MKANVELRPNETVIEETKGDLWSGWLIFRTQNSGIYTFTNQRVLFTPGRLLSMGSDIEFDYNEVYSIKKCLIGPVIPFLPFGIKVTTKEGKKHTLSLMKRNKWIDLIESKRQH